MLINHSLYAKIFKFIFSASSARSFGRVLQGQQQIRSESVETVELTATLVLEVVLGGLLVEAESVETVEL